MTKDEAKKWSSRFDEAKEWSSRFEEVLNLSDLFLREELRKISASLG